MNRISRLGKYEVCEHNDPKGGYFGLNTRTGEIVKESKYRKVVVRNLLKRHEKDVEHL